MGILVPFTKGLPYNAGTGSPVISPVLCMVGTGMGTLRRFVLPQKQNFFPKTFRYDIKLDELYAVVEKLLSWSFYFYAHKPSQRPPFCFAQAYRRGSVMAMGGIHASVSSYTRFFWYIFLHHDVRTVLP